MIRLLPFLLLVACVEPSAPPPAADTSPPMPEARGVDSFPHDSEGCYRCGVTSIYSRPGVEEPTERERVGAVLSLGPNVHAPGVVIATIEGCPLYVTRAPQVNPESFALGPNTCGETRYHDGFLIIWSEVIRGELIFRNLPSGEAVGCGPGECATWERTEWFVTVQITGRMIGSGPNSGTHAIHTYDCMRDPCMR